MEGITLRSRRSEELLGTHEFVFANQHQEVVFNGAEFNQLINIIQDIVNRWAIHGDNFDLFEVRIGRLHVRMGRDFSDTRFVAFFCRSGQQGTVDAGISFNLAEISEFQDLIIGIIGS